MKIRSLTIRFLCSKHTDFEKFIGQALEIILLDEIKNPLPLEPDQPYLKS